MSRIVGCVGVGIMGSRMSQNLRRAGFRVVAYDRNPEALSAAAGHGLDAAPDLPSLAREAEVMLLSLPTPDSVLSVVEGPDGLLAHARSGAYICDASSVDPGTSRRIHEAARSRGVHALDCPVSGGPPGAEAGTLTIMVGAEEVDLEAVRPILQAIGKKIVHCGGPGSGQVAKLVNQALVAVHTAGVIEALLVGRKYGLSLDTLVAILRSSSGASWMLENHVRFKALAGNYEPGFALDLMFKDLSLFLQTAREVQVPAFIAGTVQHLYNTARAAGHGKLDQTVVAREMERIAHVELGKLTPDA